MCHYPTLGAGSGSRERRADIGEAPSHPLRHPSDYEPGYIEYLIDVTGEARVSCSSDGFRFCRRLLLLPRCTSAAIDFEAPSVAGFATPAQAAPFGAWERLADDRN